MPEPSPRTPYKARPDLLPADALLAILRVMASGASTYGDRGWEAGRPVSRDYGALLRHLWAWWSGEERDGHSGEHPLAHVAARAIIMLALSLRGTPGVDDRPASMRPTPPQDRATSD